MMKIDEAFSVAVEKMYFKFISISISIFTFIGDRDLFVGDGLWNLSERASKPLEEGAIGAILLTIDNTLGEVELHLEVSKVDC